MNEFKSKKKISLAESLAKLTNERLEELGIDERIDIAELLAEDDDIEKIEPKNSTGFII